MLSLVVRGETDRLLKVNVTALYITTVSFYGIYSPACFDVNISLSGSCKFGKAQM